MYLVFLSMIIFLFQVFSQDHVKSSLQTIYENNVLGFCNGRMGAVNGFLDGAVDTFTVQSLEVWTGVTYALAAIMICEVNTRKQIFDSL